MSIYGTFNKSGNYEITTDAAESKDGVADCKPWQGFIIFDRSPALEMYLNF